MQIDWAVVYINCSECQNKNKKHFVCTQFMFSTCSELAIFMNFFLSYCGLVDARISASEKDLPVHLVVMFLS